MGYWSQLILYASLRSSGLIGNAEDSERDADIGCAQGDVGSQTASWNQDQIVFQLHLP